MQKRKNNHKRIFPFVFLPSLMILMLIASASVAGGAEKEMVPSTTITIDQVNLTAQQFFAAFVSPKESERDRAMLYMLGVLDSTEKKSWCAYSTLKTITIRENIFEFFKKLSSDKLKNRASSIIEEAMHSLFPCGVRKINSVEKSDGKL